jgi:hypothetical protein
MSPQSLKTSIPQRKENEFTTIIGWRFYVKNMFGA